MVFLLELLLRCQGRDLRKELLGLCWQVPARKEQEGAVVEDCFGQVLDDWQGLGMEVPVDGFGPPPADEFNDVVVNAAAKEGHGASRP